MFGVFSVKVPSENTEMARIFAGGDKVFAKMRGYPAWPARVESIADSSPNNTKYHVLFFGTMQRGICRSQELFPYAENKEKYGKIIKRKGFKEALEQIEGHAPIPELVPKIEKYRNGPRHLPKNNVHKIINNIDNTVHKKKRVVKRREILEREEMHEEFEEYGMSLMFKEVENTSLEPSQKQPKSYTGDKRKQNPSKAEDMMPCLPDPGSETARIPDVNPPKGQKASPKSAWKSTKKGVSSKKLTSPPPSPSNHNSPDDPSTLSSTSYEKPNQLSSPSCNISQAKQSSPETVSRSGRVIKRKSFHDDTEEKITTPIKRKRITHRKEEERVKNDVAQKESLKKQKDRNWLATENCLTKLDTLVRSQLNIKRANPEQCIQYLDDIKRLDLKPLMLKKHPEVVETIKRLRKYVGNSNAWDFSEEQRKVFQEKASEIRKKAESIFEKFKSMFCSRDDLAFLKVFADCVISFQAKTRNWPTQKIYALTSEPEIKPKKSSKSKAKG